MPCWGILDGEDAAPVEGGTRARADFSPEISQDRDWYTYLRYVDLLTSGEDRVRLVVVPAEQVCPGLWRVEIEDGFVALNSSQVYRTRGAAFDAGQKEHARRGDQA